MRQIDLNEFDKQRRELTDFLAQRIYGSLAMHKHFTDIENLLDAIADDLVDKGRCIIERKPCGVSTLRGLINQYDALVNEDNEIGLGDVGELIDAVNYAKGEGLNYITLNASLTASGKEEKLFFSEAL